MEEKIKDLYNCTKLDGDDSLIAWYNQVIEKSMYEMTIADVARCIRQGLFLETAYDMLLVYLLHNPYVGDAFLGELMEKAANLDVDYICLHKESILEIIHKANIFISTYEWDNYDDRAEFIESVQILTEKVYKKI